MFQVAMSHFDEMRSIRVSGLDTSYQLLIGLGNSQPLTMSNINLDYQLYIGLYHQIKHPKDACLLTQWSGTAHLSAQDAL